MKYEALKHIIDGLDGIHNSNKDLPAVDLKLRVTLTTGMTYIGKILELDEPLEFLCLSYGKHSDQEMFINLENIVAVSDHTDKFD